MTRDAGSDRWRRRRRGPPRHAVPGPSRLLFDPTRRAVPWVPQTADADCGPACLAMTLACFGKELPLEEIRTWVYRGRDASSARLCSTPPASSACAAAG